MKLKSFGISCTAFGIMLMSMYHSTLSAAPTGSDLLYACSVSVESGFDGITGQMCTWYATPCDCNVSDDLPRVCLPEDLSMPDAAQIIIQGLKNDIELQNQSATEAAIRILARNYPCQEVK